MFWICSGVVEPIFGELVRAALRIRMLSLLEKSQIREVVIIVAQFGSVMFAARPRILGGVRERVEELYWLYWLVMSWVQVEIRQMEVGEQQVARMLQPRVARLRAIARPMPLDAPLQDLVFVKFRFGKQSKGYSCYNSYFSSQVLLLQVQLLFSEVCHYGMKRSCLS